MVLGLILAHARYLELIFLNSLRESLIFLLFVFQLKKQLFLQELLFANNFPFFRQAFGARFSFQLFELDIVLGPLSLFIALEFVVFLEVIEFFDFLEELIPILL